jgi:hypothetical protein
LKAQTHHAREAVALVKQQQAHVLAMASKAEDSAAISEQSYEKFVRENADRKQKLQDGDRIAAAAELLAKHTKSHTDKDDLLLQLQVLTGLPDAIVCLYLMHMLQVTEAAAEEKLRALRDARGALLIAQRRVADADNRLTCASEGNRRISRSTLRRAGLPATAPPSWGQASSAPSRRPTSL